MKTIEEVRTVSETDKALMAEVKSAIQDILSNAEILLYGSAARGTRGPESDYDILVLTDGRLSDREKRGIERKLLDMELVHDIILSTAYHARTEWTRQHSLPFHSEVEKYGVLL